MTDKIDELLELEAGDSLVHAAMGEVIFFLETVIAEKSQYSYAGRLMANGYSHAKDLVARLKKDFSGEALGSSRLMLLALKAAQEWLEAIDQHEKLVDQDPNYGGYVTSGLIGIMNHRERFRQALAEFQKGESRE